MSYRFATYFRVTPGHPHRRRGALPGRCGGHGLRGTGTGSWEVIGEMVVNQQKTMGKFEKSAFLRVNQQKTVGKINILKG